MGGACYPEGHPESPNKQADLDGIRKKVDAGCAFLTTQMFFDNNILYNFLFRLLKHGINVPVVAGIMPITNVRQVKRTFALSGANLPPRFRAIVDRFGDDPAAMKQAGIAYATEQIIDLIANGVSHVHIYTMNQPDIAGRIIGNLSEIFPVTAFERETLRYLGNAKADERLMALIASVEAELRQEVRPRGLHRRLPIVVSEGRVEAGGHVFESRALAKSVRLRRSVLPRRHAGRGGRQTAAPLRRPRSTPRRRVASRLRHLFGRIPGQHGKRPAPGGAWVISSPPLQPWIWRFGHIEPTGDVCPA